MVSSGRLSLGRRAEDLVAGRLRGAGWLLLARNARSRHGEIDLVCLDGRTLVFVEVKAARAGTQLGPPRPILGVGPRKQRQVRRLAGAWIAANRDLPRYTGIRFDAIGVTIAGDGRVLDFEHIENAF